MPEKRINSRLAILLHVYAVADTGEKNYRLHTTKKWLLCDGVGMGFAPYLFPHEYLTEHIREGDDMYLITRVTLQQDRGQPYQTDVFTSRMASGNTMYQVETRLGPEDVIVTDGWLFGASIKAHLDVLPVALDRRASASRLRVK